MKEFGEITQFLISDGDISPDTKSEILLGNPDNLIILHNIVFEFKKITDWSAVNIAQIFKEFLVEHNLKMPNIGPLLRACIAGVTNTPDLASVLAILGRDKTIQRIEKYIANK